MVVCLARRKRGAGFDINKREGETRTHAFPQLCDGTRFEYPDAPADRVIASGFDRSLTCLLGDPFGRSLKGLNLTHLIKHLIIDDLCILIHINADGKVQIFVKSNQHDFCLLPLSLN
jgi:hypothetical protein